MSVGNLVSTNKYSHATTSAIHAYEPYGSCLSPCANSKLLYEIVRIGQDYQPFILYFYGYQFGHTVSDDKQMTNDYKQVILVFYGYQFGHTVSDDKK
jgi:hypothetical protein